ncbi:hypothetical protein TNCV_172521 [Trichonephila clavipes]|nr:hypothetical protein TNCV_172521 [Trichonephila clavipes]
MNPVRQMSPRIGGRSSRVVKVSDRASPCHEFEPSTTQDPPCREAMHILKENLRASSEKLGIEEPYQFYHDNDPKHSAHDSRL